MNNWDLWENIAKYVKKGLNLEKLVVNCEHSEFDYSEIVSFYFKQDNILKQIELNHGTISRFLFNKDYVTLDPETEEYDEYMKIYNSNKNGMFNLFKFMKNEITDARLYNKKIINYLEN